jgi:hypothetical protein
VGGARLEGERTTMESHTQQPLIPLADRPLAGPEYEDSQQQTIWHNPTDKPVILNLHFETPKPGRPPRNWEEKNGMHRYVIKPGETKAIPSMFDMGIQHTQCFHLECLHRPFACRSTEEGHEKAIVGGFGPQLHNRGTQKMPIKPGFIQIAPALDDALARQHAAEQEEFRQWQQKKMAEERALAARAEQERATADAAARNVNATDKNPNTKK